MAVLLYNTLLDVGRQQCQESAAIDIITELDKIFNGNWWNWRNIEQKKICYIQDAEANHVWNKLNTALDGGSKADAGVGSVEDGVVVLQELLANNSIDTGAATVVDPGVVLAGG